MATPAKSLTQTDAMQYEVSWKTNTIGYTKDADPSGIKLMSVDQKIGELSNMRVDSVIRGIDGSVKITLHEVKVERIRQLMPWASATGSFSVNPSGFNTSKYASAGLLTLHPKGDAGTTNDLNFLKAYPNVSLPKSAGDDFRELMIEFELFPDQTALTDPTTPTITFGYVGAPPA